MQKKDIIDRNIHIMERGEKLISLVVEKYTDSEEFKYIWSRLKAEYINNKIKIVASNEYYLSIENLIINKKIYMIIDKRCLMEKNNVVICDDSKKIIKLLIENYWELDEVCIVSEDYDWIILINHMYEIFFVGKDICDFFAKLNENESVKKNIIRKEM